jgi:hypothetical protein
MGADEYRVIAGTEFAVATSIAFLPSWSSLMTISTSSCSSLFSSLMKPGRCSMPELPDTVSEKTH